MTPDEKETLLLFIQEKRRIANRYLMDAVELSGEESGYARYQRGYLAALHIMEKKVYEI
jgi:hypothetical protein